MDWRTEAVRALGSYHARKASLKSMELEFCRMEMEQPCTADPMNSMVRKAELARSCRETALWVQTVDNALAALCDSERKLLTDLIICPRWGNLKQLQEETGHTRSTLYRKRDKALRNFTLAMYGRE